MTVMKEFVQLTQSQAGPSLSGLSGKTTVVELSWDSIFHRNRDKVRKMDRKDGRRRRRKEER